MFGTPPQYPIKISGNTNDFENMHQYNSKYMYIEIWLKQS